MAVLPFNYCADFLIGCTSGRAFHFFGVTALPIYCAFVTAVENKFVSVNQGILVAELVGVMSEKKKEKERRLKIRYSATPYK